MIFSPLKITLCAIVLALGACDKVSDSNIDKPSVNPLSDKNTWPPLADVLPCLAQSGPFISQHRARSRETDHADNSMSGFTRLRQNGYIMGEVDIARLKDGTHILYHDGVWDDDSTGRGAISASTINVAKSLLLKNPRGAITSDRVVTLDELLEFSDRQLYLEIDFKASANEKSIISALKDNDMLTRVILIAYNVRQAIDLKRYASDAIISAPVNSANDIKAYKAAGFTPETLLAWLGTKDYDASLARELKRQGIMSAFGMMSPRYAASQNYGDMTIIVTDYADEAREKAGITVPASKRLDICMQELTQ